MGIYTTNNNCSSCACIYIHINMRKKFIVFLKLHDALIPFICNLALLESEWHVSFSLSQQFKHCKGDERNLIARSFFWGFTSEGPDYWVDLSIKWKNLLDYGMEDIS